MARREKAGPWRASIWPYVGRAALLLVVLASGYTLVLMLFASPREVIGWLSTLFSTIISVFSALVVGLALFEYQARETDRKKRRDLSEFLKVELNEVEGSMREKPSKIDVPVYTKQFRPLRFHAYVEHHLPNPLIVDEAIKSGLFGFDLTAELLALSRLMGAHRLAVEEAVGLSLVVAGREAMDLYPDEDPRERVRYGMAVLSVISSEESLIKACDGVLELVASSEAEE